jgi:hypothetical protein
MKKNVLREQFAQIVETQLAKNDPPLVRDTLDRLQQQGFSEAKAKDLISICVAEEMMSVILTDQPFNRDRYQHWLQQLPNLPQD